MISNMTDYLEQTAVRFPDKTAFVDSEREICYRDFRREVRRTASVIIARGIRRESVVVFLDKNITALQTIWGIIYSGCFYTTIDIHMPVSRIERILDTLQPSLVITDEVHREIVSRFTEDAKILTTEEISEQDEQESLVEKCISQIIDTDVLYTFFTSGSTGLPKGVVISHRAVLDFVEAATERFDITEKEIIGNQGAFHFDLSTLDIYCTVATGATMHIIPPQYFKFPIKLLEYIAENKINMIYWVPSALVLVANLRALKAVDVSCLKKVTFCGEVMPCKQLNVWRRALPNAMYANMYGPTETTCASTYYIVNREFEDGDSLPIGVPFKNTRVLLLTDDGREAGEGETGEICIAGSSLAYGYYKNEEKTKESFVTYQNGAYEEKIYRTGDLAKYNEYGELIYLSRKDFQIKHMGHRIELGEIETAINSIAEITECCCMYDEQKHKIVAFLETGMEETEIADRLKMMIPEYMLPNKYHFLEKMPHNANGKIDRAALKKEV